MEKEKELKLELYAEELQEITEFTGAVTPNGYSTFMTETTLLSASCPTSSASTYTSASTFSW